MYAQNINYLSLIIKQTKIKVTQRKDYVSRTTLLAFSCLVTATSSLYLPVCNGRWCQPRPLAPQNSSMLSNSTSKKLQAPDYIIRIIRWNVTDVLTGPLTCRLHAGKRKTMSYVKVQMTWWLRAVFCLQSSSRTQTDGCVFPVLRSAVRLLWSAVRGAEPGGRPIA